jgi:hypothetical protein
MNARLERTTTPPAHPPNLFTNQTQATSAPHFSLIICDLPQRLLPSHHRKPITERTYNALSEKPFRPSPPILEGYEMVAQRFSLGSAHINPVSRKARTWLPQAGMEAKPERLNCLLQNYPQL